MLEHASGSRHIDPGRPPAAAGDLGSQVPDLVLGSRSTVGSCSRGRSKRIDTLLRHETDGVHRLGCLGYPTSTEEQRTRATCMHDAVNPYPLPGNCGQLETPLSRLTRNLAQATRLSAWTMDICMDFGMSPSWQWHGQIHADIHRPGG